MLNHYCQCTHKTIVCDNFGCRCSVCGGMEDLKLNELKPTSYRKPQLWIDSDGVLADFNERWFRFYSQDAETLKDKMGKKELWKSVRNYDPYFFQNLKPISGAYELINTTAHLKPIILTGSPTEWGYIQKIRWFQFRYPELGVIVCKSKEKHLFCEPGDIIVDDRVKYKHLWEEAGGIWITHTDWRSSVEQLKELGVL